MSQLESTAATPLAETMTEDSIADYLKSHPDFFERHGALMLGLKLPHRTGGASISLVERQVSMLRQRNGQLERQLKDLVAVAKQNDVLVEKIHQLCLKLMRAPTLLQRLERLETGLREDFAAERAVLVLFPAAPAEVARMRRALGGWLERLDLEPARRQDAILAASEAAANAAEHAYGFDGVGIVHVEASLSDGELELSIRDRGGWREPRIDEGRGRGRRIMEALMQVVTVDGGDEGTVVRMRLPTRDRSPV